jgi:hypothetical protein
MSNHPPDWKPATWAEAAKTLVLRHGFKKASEMCGASPQAIRNWIKGTYTPQGRYQTTIIKALEIPAHVAATMGEDFRDDALDRCAKRLKEAETILDKTLRVLIKVHNIGMDKPLRDRIEIQGNMIYAFLTEDDGPK